MQTTKKTKRILSFLLVVSMILSAIPARSVSALAAEPTDLISTIKAVSGLDAAWDESTGTVTITGTATAEYIDSSPTLDLTIPEGVTIDWQADLTSYANQTININNASGINTAFNMTSGKIINTFDGNHAGGSTAVYVASQSTVMTVFDGEIKGSDFATYGGNYGIYSKGPLIVKGGLIYGGKGADTTYGIMIYAGTLTVEGGTIDGGEGEMSTGINTYGSVTVLGGTITGGGGIYTECSYGIAGSGTINISGGTLLGGISNDECNVLVHSGTNTVTISGGKIISNTGAAIYFNDDAATANINNNAVIFGKGSTSTITKTTQPTPTNNAIIVTWTGSGSSYDQYSDDDLTVSAASSASPKTAEWDIVDGKYGVTYTCGTNTGFIEVSGVTVTPEVIDYTLYFKNDSSGWNLYKGDSTNLYKGNKGNWFVSGDELTLGGTDSFVFSTTAPNGLIVPETATIVLADGTNNVITSTHSGSGDADEYSSGIRADGSLTIKGETTGTGVLTATSGNSSYSSVGIRVYNSMIINSGIVNTIGGNGADSFGILTENNDITFNGGKITAKGNLYAVMTDNEISGVTTQGTTDGSTTGLVPALWSNGSYRINGTAAKYLEITLPSSTYTVTYSGNNNTSGSVPVDSNDYETDDIVTVLGNTGSLVRTGYTFAGWNMQADGLGTSYTVGDTFDIASSDVTLYAKWTEDMALANKTLASGTVGTIYSDNVTATTNATGTVTYSITTGTLPVGLSMNSSGVFSGTPTTATTTATTFTVTAIDSAIPPNTASATYTISINKGTKTPPTSVTGSYTGDGTNFTYTVTAIAGAEYSKDGANWQDSNVFTGFTTSSPATTFYARIKGDTNYNESASASTSSVTFARLTNSSVPTINYEVTGATGSKVITITAISGCEYQFGTDGWSDTNTKTYATDITETIYIRYKATGTHNESSSASQSVSLANQEQSAPSAFTLTFADNGDGTFTATIPTVTGGEYSFDGTTYTASNTKADCSPNTSYTGYVRLAAKTGYNASSVASDTKTSPKLAATVANLTYTLTDVTYNRTQQSVTIAPNTGVGAVTVKYNGSTTAPTNAGTYTITVDIAEGTGYGSATDLAIGNWTIKKASITVTADAQEKIKGETDPEFTYNITSGTLIADDTLTGSLARLVGETTGNYAITLGTLANSNYEINFMGNYLTIKENVSDPVPTLYTINGTVTNTPAHGDVTVTIMQGNKIFGKSEGTSYSFANLASGVYNITATNGTESKTVYHELTASAMVDITIGTKTAAVDVTGNDTPPVVVSVTALENKLSDVNSSLELIVEAKTVPQAITNIATGKTIAFNLDFTVVKDGTLQSTYEFNDIITAQFPIPDAAKGKSISIYRLHNGVASVMPVGLSNAIDGEYVEIGTDRITLHIKKFSDYAVAYAASTQTITATAETGGTISPSGTVTVDTGDNQTFTITANSGYSISDVKVDNVSVGKLSTYTFNNVTASHTISATFSYNGGGDGGSYTTNAQTPTIITQPTELSTIVGETKALKAAATVSDSGTLSYQWYANTSLKNTGGTVISGATSADYTVPTAKAGTYYYYVVVTNTNNSVDGSKVATVTSKAVTVTVAEKTETKQFTVTYKVNGGGTVADMPSDITKYTSGKTVTIKGTPVSTSKFFAGWNTKADGTGKSYTAGKTFKITANTTLYAQWKDTYTASSKLQYKVTSKNQVACIGTTDKKATSITIVNSFVYKGITYKVTSVAKNAFRGNEKITTVKIGNNVKTISNTAFYKCPNLSKVTIGTGLISIGNDAFCFVNDNCVITINSTKLKTVKTAINHGTKNMVIKVPKSKLKEYKKLFAKTSKTITVKEK
ncbi:InlB B-repeat-containing protein [Anaerosporobacter sp.]|uniref:InlB B-repeat-containing protein n=1 Tax=Anaerosporobacter sp. TaxID=1872529 RepID=UPI00286F6F8B|nr:InlB B-repeat-containing protein [Anaerosporobacter sp.]